MVDVRFWLGLDVFFRLGWIVAVLMNQVTAGSC